MKTIINIKENAGRLIQFMLIGFLMAACSLDIEETDSKLTEGTSAIFNGIPSAEVSGTLDNIYNDIRGQTESQENLYSLTEVSTDELLVPTRGTDWGDNGIWRTVHVHTWGPTHNHIVNVWNEKNSAVLRCSQIIDPLTTATAAQKAEAKFARAYNMWIVMDFWGQVPFRNPSDGPDVVPSVMTRAEAYAMIVTDLNEAIAGLPAGAPTSTNKTRPTKATARFLLAKVKLNTNVYLGAYGAGDLAEVISLVDAIQADGYGLVGNYFEIFKGQNVSNIDVIWNVTASTGNRMWNGLHYNQGHPGNAGGGWNGFSTLAEFYNKFEGPSATNTIGGAQEERRGYTHTLASTTDPNPPPGSPEGTLGGNGGFGYGFQLGQMYGWGDIDYDEPGTAIGPRPIRARSGAGLIFTKEFPGLVGNTDVTGMRLLKYSPANGAFASGVVMARFADAHLMRAEARLRGGVGGAAQALTEVNALRALRAQTSQLTGPMTEAIMLDERGRELYTEGWRRNDMIRFGVFKAAKEFKPAGDGHTDLFPIPSSALLSNPGLVQNPGY